MIGPALLAGGRVHGIKPLMTMEKIIALSMLHANSVVDDLGEEAFRALVLGTLEELFRRSAMDRMGRFVDTVGLNGLDWRSGELIAGEAKSFKVAEHFLKVYGPPPDFIQN